MQRATTFITRRLVTFALAGVIATALLWPALTGAARAQAVADGGAFDSKRVLFIGIDGCRLDAIQYSQAKYLKELMEQGAYSDRTDVLGDRDTKAETITGPGWSSALSGVLADKHGVIDNAFAGQKLADYPNFLRRFKAARPEAQVAALVSWNQFRDFVFSGDTWCQLVVDGDKQGYEEGDRQVAAAAVKVLADEDPQALFVYFGNVDSVGHGYGFHPRSYKYTNGIEVVDTLIGNVLAALRGRKSYARDNWLIIVCTDHGGRGKDHGQGKNVPEIRNGFLILNGPSVKTGKIDGTTYNVDVAATALSHLGVELRPEWKLDGRPVGLK